MEDLLRLIRKSKQPPCLPLLAHGYIAIVMLRNTNPPPSYEKALSLYLASIHRAAIFRPPPQQPSLSKSPELNRGVQRRESK
jgi:hypothetical protein